MLGSLLFSPAERLDLPDFLSLQSYVGGDFEYLMRSCVGTIPYIFSGFDITNPASLIGQPASNLAINIANAVVYCPTLPVTQQGQTNATSTGAFFYGLDISSIYAQPLVPITLQNGQTNYVYLTLTLIPTSPDTRTFWDPSLNGGAGGEFTQTINTENILSVSVTSSPVAFPTQTLGSISDVLTGIPVCIVVLDGSGNISSITDARNMMFRLGTGSTGGSTATELDPYNNFTPFITEPPITITSSGGADPFHGGDKDIATLKQWMDAVMTRIKQLGGSEFWYENAPLYPSDYQTYTFYLSPAGTASASATYTDTNGNVYTVVTSIVSSATLVATGLIAPAPFGILTLTTGVGDATLDYTSYLPPVVPGVPIRGIANQPVVDRVAELTLDMGDEQEDRSAFIRSDAEVTWSGGQLTFPSDIVLEIDNTKAGGEITTHTVPLAASPITLADGYCLYVNINRAPSGNAEILSAAGLGGACLPGQYKIDSVNNLPAQQDAVASTATKDIFVLFRCHLQGGNLFLYLPFTKQLITTNQTTYLGASGGGGGGSGWPVASVGAGGTYPDLATAFATMTSGGVLLLATPLTLSTTVTMPNDLIMIGRRGYAPLTIDTNGILGNPGDTGGHIVLGNRSELRDINIIASAVQATGDITNVTNRITHLSSTTGISAGNSIFDGNFIPLGTTVVSVDPVHSIVVMNTGAMGISQNNTDQIIFYTNPLSGAGYPTSGTTTALSNIVVCGLSITTSLVLGQQVLGNGISTPTTIIATPLAGSPPSAPGTIRISTFASNNGTTPLAFYSATGVAVGPYLGDVTNVTNQITNLNTITNIVNGQYIVGPGIPNGTTVSRISGNVITMSANATAAAVGETITFYQGTSGNSSSSYNFITMPNTFAQVEGCMFNLEPGGLLTAPSGEYWTCINMSGNANLARRCMFEGVLSSTTAVGVSVTGGAQNDVESCYSS